MPTVVATVREAELRFKHIAQMAGLAHWWKLDEGIGTTARNAAAAHHLTWQGSPTVVAGSHGNAIKLNGTNAYLRWLTDDATQPFALNGAHAFEFYGTMHTFANSFPGLFKYGSGDVPGSGYLMYHTSQGAITYRRDGKFATSPNGLLTSTPAHIIVSYDPATQTVTWFRNGAAFGTSAVAGGYATMSDEIYPSLQVGLGDAGQYANVTLDEVRLWTRSFDAAAAKKRYRNGQDHWDAVKPRLVSWTETNDDMIGDWGAQVYNGRSRLKGLIKSGDEVEIWARYDNEAQMTRRFAGLVGAIGRDFRQARKSEYDISGSAFEAKLQFERTTRHVASSTDVGRLIHEVMGGNGLGISLAGVANPFGTSVSDIVFDDVDLYQFLQYLADIVGAGWHIDKDRVLHFYLRGTVASGITETGSTCDDLQTVEDCEGIVNVVRGYGGVAKSMYASQATQTAYATVTDATTKTVRLRWPSDTVHLVEIWARAVAGSASSLDVRIEADDAGLPSGVPLARYVIQPSDIPAAGAYVLAFMPPHIVAPGSFLNIIVGGTTSQGVQVGVNGSGDLTYRAYVGYPLVSQVTDAASVAKYGRREGRPIRDADIVRSEQLDQLLAAHLEKFSEPTITARLTARNPAYLTAARGSTVTLNAPEIDEHFVNRPMVVLGRTFTIKGTQLEVEVTLADGTRGRGGGSLLDAMLRRLEALEAVSRRKNAQTLVVATASDSIQAVDDAAGWSVQNP